MIKLAPVLFAFCLAAPLNAQDTVDLGGLVSWGLDGDPGNQTSIFFPGPLDSELGYIVLTIQYDITIHTLGTSRLDEVNIRFGNSDGTFDGVWPDTFRPGQSHPFSGTQRFTGSFHTDFHLNPDAEFHVGLFESFDNDPFGVDAVLLPGSTMTLFRFIPAPGSAPLLAGLALAMGVRRRRR